MNEIFFVIGLLFLLGGIIKAVSGNSHNVPIDLNPKAFKSGNYVPILIGSFNSHQYINNERFDFISTVEYDKSDYTLIVLIDGRKMGTKMKLDKISRSYVIEIINKAIDWSEKAKEANLTATKLISTINTPVSFVVDKVYFSNSEIKFDFYNDSNNSNGSAIMVISNKYDIGGVLTEPSIIFINRDQFEKVKLMITEESIKSVLNERAEKNEIVDEILN